LEARPRWHTLTYLCTMLKCYKNVFQIDLGNQDSCDVNIELEGNGALDIHEYACACYFIFASRSNSNLINTPRNTTKSYIGPNISSGKLIPSYGSLLEIMLIATCPCAISCNQMSLATTNGCLCNYFSNFDEVWSSFQLGCNYDLFHP